MILIIDHFDSFVQTLARYMRQLRCVVKISRQDEITARAACATAPEAIILSPGPGTPDTTGITLPLIKMAAGRIPILGVCLGHQAIAQHYGASITHAANPMHGKLSLIVHYGRDIFDGLPNPLPAGRYHSLGVQALPDCLEVAAHSGGDIMAFRHKVHPVWGVQFHPESVLTPDGLFILKNFLRMARNFNKKQATKEQSA